MKIEVHAITLICGNGADLVMLHLDMPDGCYPFTGHATASMHVAKDDGERYVVEHFPGAPTTIVRR